MEQLQSNTYVDEFIASLEESTISKILRMIEILKEEGPRIGMPYSKKVESHIFELRIHGEQAVRIFYTFYRGRVILLHAYKKKSEKIPLKELMLAKRRLYVLTGIT